MALGPGSSALVGEVWDTIAGEAAAESPLWAAAVLTDEEREPDAVFSPLAEAHYELGLETIYEGYLLHYGRPRLFRTDDRDTAVLLGDYLYAHGLVQIAALGDVDVVADLADLISVCAHLRASGRSGDGAAWASAAALLGRWRATAAGAAEDDWLALARAAAGERAVEEALAAHTRRVA